MTPRHKKIILISFASLAVLIIGLVVASFFVTQRPWFRDYVRQRIISAVEESTGGRVEIGEFLFDPRQLRVEIRQFVLHGTEPADQAPLFQTRSLTAKLRLPSLLRRRWLDIAFL